jgi:hypothetical protein
MLVAGLTRNAAINAAQRHADRTGETCEWYAEDGEDCGTCEHQGTRYRITATRNGEDVASGETLGDCYGHTYADRDEAESHAAYLQTEADDDPDDLCHGVEYAVEEV